MRLVVHRHSVRMFKASSEARDGFGLADNRIVKTRHVEAKASKAPDVYAASEAAKAPEAANAPEAAKAAKKAAKEAAQVETRKSIRADNRGIEHASWE